MTAEPVRFEDARLLIGAGRFVADLVLPGALHMHVVRSDHAHATILAIDTQAACAMEGVHAVLTAAEVAADGLGGIPWEVAPPGAEGCAEGDPAVAPPQSLLAVGRVRYVGEPVAVVIADTACRAWDAAELIAIHYAPQPAVTTPAEALAESAPVLHAGQDNACFRFGHGDAAATEAAFAGAHTRVSLPAVNQRLAAAPIETRGYAGVWDAAAERWTLHAAAGKPHGLRRTLARFVFRVPETQIRVVVGGVGGGFGAKNVLYAEAALVLWVARRLGRHVRWQATRAEAFCSDMAGRDHTSVAEMAFAADGRMLAVRVASLVNLGAWLGARAVNPAISGAKILGGAYAIPVGRLDVTGVYTNTVPTCPYRGAGAPEMMFLIERLVDLGAHALGVSPAALRRRNAVPHAALPLATIGGVTYDSCDFVAALDRALVLSGWDGFADRRAQASRAGKQRGIGLSLSLEAYGAALDEAAEMEIGPDGFVDLRIGTQSSGQSHATAYAILAGGRLGVGAEWVRVLQGDTDRIARGHGTGASRSLTVGGSATVLACRHLIEAGLPRAAEVLEAGVGDVAFEEGAYRVVGTDRWARLQQVAAECGGWSATGAFQPSGHTFPYGCHVAEVEVDPETGAVRVLRYTAVQDCGNAVLPRVVAGQLQGGIAQGLGQALTEATRHDPAHGQLLTASFMDYAVPRASDVPGACIELLSVPTAANLLGAKAVGEAGPTAAPPAIINAIVDAIGARHLEMPATAESVWRAGLRR